MCPQCPQTLIDPSVILLFSFSDGRTCFLVNTQYLPYQLPLGLWHGQAAPSWSRIAEKSTEWLPGEVLLVCAHVHAHIRVSVCTHVHVFVA